MVRVAADAGETFLDRIISLVEGAKRRKTPNEIALNILLASLALIFLVVCVTLRPLSAYAMSLAGQGQAVTITALVALSLPWFGARGNIAWGYFSALREQIDACNKTCFIPALCLVS